MKSAVSDFFRKREESFSFAIQIAVLILTFYFGTESRLQSMIEQQRLEFSATCISEVQDLAVQTEPEIFIRARLLPLLRLSPKASALDYKKIALKYKKYWDLDISLYRFSPGGDLLFFAPQSSPHQWLMKNLYKALVLQTGTEFEQIRRQVEKKIHYVFGEGKDLEIIQDNQGKILSFFATGEEGSFAWNSSKSGGIIVYCHKNPSDAGIFRSIIRSKTKKKYINAGFGKPGDSQGPRSGNAPDSEAMRVLDDCKSKKLLSEIDRDRLWSFQETISGRMLYAVFPRNPDSFAGLQLLLQICVFGLSPFAIFLGIYFGITVSMNLRRLLLTLFIAAAAMPLAGIAIGSLDILQGYEQMVGQRIRNAQNSTLLGIIRDFADFLAASGRDLVEISKNPGSGKDPEINKKMVAALHAKGFLKQFFVRDSSGNLLFSNCQIPSPDKEIFNRSMAREGVERYAPGRLQELPWKGSALMDKIVKTEEMGFPSVLRSPGILQFLQTGVSQTLYFFQVYPENIGGAAFIGIRLPFIQGVMRYLRNKIRERRNFNDLGIRVFALNSNTLSWTVPPPKKFRRELKDIAVRTWVTGQSQSRRVKIAGLGGFVFCLPTSKLADHCLIAFCSDSQLQKEIESSWKSIFWGIGLLFLLLFFLAHGLSENLLSPLRHLEDGTKALFERNFDFRLPELDGGDVGRLFSAFNTMMLESRDLQVARQVQEGLIPKEFPILEGYSIFGKILTASDLGGDCLDCFSLPDGRIVFLVGDISGHGVGSALIMAFAKAVTFHWSQKPDPSPSSLAFELDRTLRIHRISKAFMGAICGILNPESHKLDIVVQGHIFPLLFRNNGTFEWVGKPAYPLGIGRARNFFPVQSCFLEKGDALFCVTDGFIEALNSKNEQFGYERFTKWAGEIPRSDARECVDTMIDRHITWSNHCQNDDVTLLGIVRGGSTK